VKGYDVFAVLPTGYSAMVSVYQLCSINCFVRVKKTIPSMLDRNDFHTGTIIGL